MTGFLRRVTCGLLLLAVALMAMAPLAQAAPPSPEVDPFYKYTGSKPLSEIAAGTVLKTRTLSYHVLGVPLPVPAIQLLYRASNELGEPTVNVTSVLKPLLEIGAPQVVAYQSFYDSLSPVDEPSYAISGGLTLGGAIPQVESALVGPSLLAGRTVVIADTEGEAADFAAGPEDGNNTLASLKAANASPATRPRVGARAGANLRADDQRQAGLGNDGRRPRRPGPQPALRRRQPQLGGGDADGDHRRLACLPHQPHALPERIRERGLRETRKSVDRQRARSVSGANLDAAGEARIPDAGERPGLRPHREPADHGDARHADDPAADLPGRPRRAGRDGGEQAGDRRGRRRDDRRRRPQPGAPVLRQRREGPVHPVSPRPHRHRSALDRRSDDLDERPVPRPARALELPEHRPRELAGPDRRIGTRLMGRKLKP